MINAKQQASMRAAAAAFLWLAGLAAAAPPARGAPPLPDVNAARGVLRAERDAVLSSSVSERIVQMPFREGDTFAKGDALVIFDCARLGAELRAARAGAGVEARNAKVQEELLSMDATGRADADIAKLKERERYAQAQAIQERMSGCRVLAPYAGRVAEAMVRIDETPPPNDKLIRIVSDGPLELHMVIPSRWLSWLHSDSTLVFKVDETGDTLQAKVKRISAAVDAVSQTVKVVAAVENTPPGVLPGMSGRATLDNTKAGEAAVVNGAQLTSAKVPARAPVPVPVMAPAPAIAPPAIAPVPAPASAPATTGTDLRAR